MTTKEKAAELVDKYYLPNITWALIHAKKSALIAVDEILSHHSQEQGLYKIDKYYWEEVKKEIEKL